MVNAHFHSHCRRLRHKLGKPGPVSNSNGVLSSRILSTPAPASQKGIHRPKKSKLYLMTAAPPPIWAANGWGNLSKHRLQEHFDVAILLINVSWPPNASTFINCKPHSYLTCVTIANKDKRITLFRAVRSTIRAHEISWFPTISLRLFTSA
jgi:hypothetical protein